MIFDAQPSIVGHRGFGSGHRGGYRENTVASFLAAVACGVSWVELDVHRSRDGELVVRHDPVAPGRRLHRDAVRGRPRGRGRRDAGRGPGRAARGRRREYRCQDHHRRCGGSAGATHVRWWLTYYIGSRERARSSSPPSTLRCRSTWQDRREYTGDVALGLITGIDFPAHHAIAAAANLGLDAVCLHTGTLNLHRDQMRPCDLSAERIIETAHRAGLEVLTWSPSPAEAVRSPRRAWTRSASTTSRASRRRWLQLSAAGASRQ